MSEIPLRLLQDSLLARAGQLPDKLAVVAEDARLSYAELADAALRLARGLQDLGVARGDRVAIYMENSSQVIVGVYGALLAGAVFMVVNPQTKGDKLSYMLADSGASAVLVDAGHLAAAVERVRAGLGARHTVIVNTAAGPGAGAAPRDGDDPASPRLGDGSAAAPQDGDPPSAQNAAAVSKDSTIVTLPELLASSPPQPRPHGTISLDLAALIYTSGSTGNPKGVMLSHRNMVFTQASLVQYLRLDASERILNVLPLAFDYGLYQALMTVQLGATLILERSFSFPAHTVKRAREEEATVFPGVPTVFATLLALHRKQPLSLPSIRRLTNTAAHLPDDYVAGLLEISPGALVYKMYGLTECKRVSYLEPELVYAKPSSVGKAIPGTEIYLVGDAGERVDAAGSGILHVRGAHVMMGYWNLPEQTDHMLKPGPYPGEKVLCTHDRFRLDEGGFLYFEGRTDDIIKSRGEKISPIEVENVLHGIEGVREAAVVGVPDDLLGEAVRAYVVLHEGVSLDERSFKRLCLAKLESFMVPRDVVFVGDLPKTATGKVRKKSLLELAS